MSLRKRMQEESKGMIVYFKVKAGDIDRIEHLKNIFERCVLTDEETGKVVYDFRDENCVELPDVFLGMEMNFTFEYKGVEYLLYDCSAYEGYFDFTLDLDESCVFAQKYDHDERCVVCNEIYTVFEYEGNNIEEWDSKEEFNRHQELWAKFKEFVETYIKFTKVENNL